jgi:hypothetical protein
MGYIKRFAQRRGLLSIVLILTIACSDFSAKQNQSGNNQTASYSLSRTMRFPNGVELRLREKDISLQFVVDGKNTFTSQTLIYAEARTPERPDWLRVWQRLYPFGRDAVRGMRAGRYVVSYTDDCASGIVMASIESGELRFFEMTENSAVGSNFEDRIAEMQGKSVSPILASPESRRSRMRLLDSLRPFGEYGPLVPEPRVERIWRTPKAWDISVQTAERELHFRLRDDADEWTLIENTVQGEDDRRYARMITTVLQTANSGDPEIRRNHVEEGLAYLDGEAANVLRVLLLVKENRSDIPRSLAGQICRANRAEEASRALRTLLARSRNAQQRAVLRKVVNELQRVESRAIAPASVNMIRQSDSFAGALSGFSVKDLSDQQRRSPLYRGLCAKPA